jgi:hypothetical protein
MKYLEIVNNFISMIKYLKSENNIINVENNSKLNILSNEDRNLIIEDISTEYKLILNNSFKEIIIPNIIICWHYKMNEKITTGGEINLKRTPSLFVDTSKTSFSDSLTKYGKKLYDEGYRFFDSHPHAGDGFFAAIQIEKNTITDTVWFVDIIYENIEPMELDYLAYIEHTIKLKGLYDWQYLFMEDNLNNLDFDITPLRKRLEDYPKLFPGSDVSEYMKLYKEKGGE